MKFNDKFYKYLFEANNMVLFSYLSLDDKIERLSTNPYTEGRYYHVTDPENMKEILKNGFSGDEIWFSKDKPHGEYTGGLLFEVDLSGYDLKPDPRWKEEHKVFITTKPVPSDRITGIFEYIDKIGLREDELAVQMKGASEEQIIDLIQKYEI